MTFTEFSEFIEFSDNSFVKKVIEPGASFVKNGDVGIMPTIHTSVVCRIP